MLQVFKHLDQLLRGKRVGGGPIDTEALVDIPLKTFLPLAIGLGATYGFFMGWYRIATRWGQGTTDGYFHAIASMIKVPALFLLTLAITFPSLYIFSALLGGRLAFAALMRLLVGTTVVSLAVAASFGPILAFFTLSTTNYPFMVVLNVILLSISGLVGVGFLTKGLRQLAQPTPPPLPDVAPPATAAASEGLGGIFAIWIVIYGTVGVQMAWLLRPFIGQPDTEFAWFRPRTGNFLIGLFEHLRQLGN